jgi:hypothetical protein
MFRTGRGLSFFSFWTLLLYSKSVYDYKEPCKIKIASALNVLFAEAGLSETAGASSIQAEIPPRAEMGDLGFPMFGI